MSESDKRPFYQARLSVDEDDCWRPAVDEWDACYCASLITPRQGDPLRICFGDAVVIFNRNTHKNEVAIVYNISCRPGFFDVVIFRNGAAWKTMVSSGFVLRNTGAVTGPARETFLAWLGTTNPLQRDIMQIGWSAMSQEQRDAVRLAALSQLLVEQRGMSQLAASDRARAILTAWHEHSPIGPTPIEASPGSSGPAQISAVLPPAPFVRRRQRSGSRDDIGDEEYAEPPPRRRRGAGVRPPPRKVLRSLLDRCSIESESGTAPASTTASAVGSPQQSSGSATEDERRPPPPPQLRHLLIEESDSLATTPLGPLVAAASELSEVSGDPRTGTDFIASSAAAEYELEHALRGVGGSWERMRSELAALRSRCERAEGESVRLRAERDAAVVALQRSQIAIAHISAASVAASAVAPPPASNLPPQQP